MTADLDGLAHLLRQIIGAEGQMWENHSIGDDSIVSILQRAVDALDAAEAKLTAIAAEVDGDITGFPAMHRAVLAVRRILDGEDTDG